MRLRGGENSRVVLGTAFGPGALPTLSSRMNFNISATVVSWNSVTAQVLMTAGITELSQQQPPVPEGTALAGIDRAIQGFGLLEIQVNQTTCSLQVQIRIFSPHYPSQRDSSIGAHCSIRHFPSS